MSELQELIDSAENLLAELGAAGSDGWATRSVHIDDVARLRAAIIAVESPAADDSQVLRTAVKNLLPIGSDRLPDERVVPIYVRMSELRALHALATPATSA